MSDMAALLLLCSSVSSLAAQDSLACHGCLIGLQPVQGDKKHPFKHFNPRFDRSHPSLETASALNVAFVFQKTAGAPMLSHVKTLENLH